MNPFNLMQAVQQIKSNPMAILSRRFSIPQNLKTPDEILQHLLDSGQVSQDQVNGAMQMRKNPALMQMLNQK